MWYFSSALDIQKEQCFIFHVVPFYIDSTASQTLSCEINEDLLGESNEEFDPFFLFSGKVDPDPARLHAIHQTTGNHLQYGVNLVD